MFRLLGLLGLSVTTDLGTGAPLEESMRRCLVAVLPDVDAYEAVLDVEP